MPLCCMLQGEIALYKNALNNFTLTLQSSLQLRTWDKMYNIKLFQQIMTIFLYFYVQKDKTCLKNTNATNLEQPTSPDEGTNAKVKLVNKFLFIQNCIPQVYLQILHVGNAYMLTGKINKILKDEFLTTCMSFNIPFLMSWINKRTVYLNETQYNEHSCFIFYIIFCFSLTKGQC